MKKTLAIAAAAMAVVLPLGCGGSSTGGAGGAAATAAAGTGGDTAAAGSGAAATGGDSAAGASGGTSDKCPGGAATDEFITVKTAAELTGLTGCTTFKNLTVSGTGITNLGALSSVTGVTGNLYIKDTKVTDLTGLSKLTSVGKDLYIGISLDQASQLSSVITSLTGLENLKTIGGQLQINENADLTDISALNGLASIGPITSNKLLQMRNNSSLPTCDVQKLAKQLGRDKDKSGATEICGTKSDTCGESTKCAPVT